MRENLFLDTSFLSLFLLLDAATFALPISDKRHKFASYFRMDIIIHVHTALQERKCVISFSQSVPSHLYPMIIYLIVS